MIRWKGKILALAAVLGLAGLGGLTLTIGAQQIPPQQAECFALCRGVTLPTYTPYPTYTPFILWVEVTPTPTPTPTPIPPTATPTPLPTATPTPAPTPTIPLGTYRNTEYYTLWMPGWPSATPPKGTPHEGAGLHWSNGSVRVSVVSGTMRYNGLAKAGVSHWDERFNTPGRWSTCPGVICWSAQQAGGYYLLIEHPATFDPGAVAGMLQSFKVR